MSVEAHEILALAKGWHGTPSPSEALLRSASSRAYYAALHRAISALPQDLLPTKAEFRAAGSHKAVINALSAWNRSGRVGKFSAAQVAVKLARMKNERVKADYGLGDEFSDADCKTMLGSAQHVFELLRGF
jgi:uncharacterized protein (UPF0332 family)